MHLLLLLLLSLLLFLFLFSLCGFVLCSYVADQSTNGGRSGEQRRSQTENAMRGANIMPKEGEAEEGKVVKVIRRRGAQLDGDMEYVFVLMRQAVHNSFSEFK